MAKSLSLFLVLSYVSFHFAICVEDLIKSSEIEDMIVAITGGAIDIGFAVADNFLKEGAKAVVLLDTKVLEGNKAEAKLNLKYGPSKAYFIECNVRTDLERVSKLIIDKFKYIDIFVNNEASVEENIPRKLMLINAVATIEWSLKFFEYMRIDKSHGRGGTIINIASVAAHSIDPLYPTYKASKFAIYGFSQSLGHRYNYKKYGVRVLTLCPGPTNTKLVNNVYNLYDKIIIDKVKRHYNFATVQSSDNVGKSAVQLFKTAKSGTSWDVVDDKPAFESPRIINVMP